MNEESRPNRAATTVSTPIKNNLSLPETAGIYADHAHAYKAKGYSPLPLPAGKKNPPPTGYTGYPGKVASGADIQTWADNGHANGNIALRLPETVLGLDLDDYDGKPGLATMLAAVERLGPLPQTWTSTSRPGIVSGIRFYRVPEGRCWADLLGDGVEVIHHGHRYAVAAPSIHPEGRTYRWTDPEGSTCEGPNIDELPTLPEAWVVDLDCGSVDDRAGKADLTGADVKEWLAALPGGEPCRYVTRLLEEAADNLVSRHDRMLNYSGRMVRAGDQGHRGVRDGLDSLRTTFLASLNGGKPRSEDRGEWARMVTGAVAMVVQTPTAEIDKGCCGPDAPSLAVVEYVNGLAETYDAGDQNRDVTNVTASALEDLLNIVTASDVEISRVRYLWQGRIPFGAMTLMPGEEGIGKTTVGVNLIAQITNGTLAGEMLGVPRDVLVLAAEDGIEDVFTPRLKEAGADLHRVHIIKARISTDGSDQDVIVPRDLKVISLAVEKYDAALVWIDSLVTTLPDELKTIAYKDTAKVLKKLSGWAESHNLAVAAPWHLNKASGSDTAVRIMDSRAFRTAVRSMLLIVADPDAEEGVSQGIVALDKSNASSLAVPALRYRIDSAPYIVAELDKETGEVRDVLASCGVVRWLGEVEGDGRAIAREALMPLIHKEGTPAGWLRDYLKGEGEVVRADVMLAAETEKFSESAIKRAARALGVHSREETGQDDVGRPYRRAVWSLPDSQSGHTHPTGPTDPTGEGYIGLTDLIGAGQSKSGQSGQSGLSGPTGESGDPTEDPPDRFDFYAPNPEQDALSRMPGRCPECRFHVSTQGHRESCQKSRPVNPEVGAD